MEFPFNTVLIIPFSELGTKSRATRAHLMAQLLTNIKHVLSNVFGVEWTKYRGHEERLAFQFRRKDIDAALDALQHVPGILRLVPCIEASTAIPSLVKKVGGVASSGIAPEGNAIASVRALYHQNGDKFIRDLTRALEDAGFKTDRPGGLSLEVLPRFTYMYAESKTIKGLNGLPVGTHDPLLVDVVGRPSDAIAAVDVAARGVVITPVYHHLGSLARDPVAHESMLGQLQGMMAKFHGFPVAREYHVKLDAILRNRGTPAAEGQFIEEHPCVACTLARRAVAFQIARVEGMLPLLVDGLMAGHDSVADSSCPVSTGVAAGCMVRGLGNLFPLFLQDAGAAPRLLHRDRPAIKNAAEALAVPGSPPEPRSTWDFCAFKGVSTPRDGAGFEESKARFLSLVARSGLDHVQRVERGKDGSVVRTALPSRL